MRPSKGSWSILKSPVCRTVPPSVRMKTAKASGIEWFTAMNSHSNGPNCSTALGNGQRVRLDPMLLQLRLHQGQRQLGSDQRDVGLEAQQIGNSTDVVFVAMREHHANNILQPVLDVREVRKDQINAGLRFLGKKYAAVNDQQLAVDFEDRHVAAYLPVHLAEQSAVCLAAVSAE